MRETDADRSWKAGHGQAWISRRDEQGRSNARHSCLVTVLHSESGGPGDSCARTFFWKRELRFGRWCFKSGDTKTEAQCSCLIPQKPKEIYSANRKVWWLDNSRAQGRQRRTWITDTLSWYQFSPLNGIRVKPKLHRRRRRLYERSKSRRRSQKLFFRTIY